MTCPSISSICETEGFGIYTVMHRRSPITVHLLKTIIFGMDPSYIVKYPLDTNTNDHIATGLLST